MCDLAFEPEGSKKCGCYVLGLADAPPSKNVLMPLRICEYRIEIVNAIVNVTLLQIYQNPTDKFLQAEYYFPVAANACIHRLVADLGGKRIQCVVKQKQEARQQYEKSLQEGRKTAYCEQNANDKEVIRLKIGNIGPKQRIKIQIQYLHQLTLSFNTFYELHVPASISPNYLNHIAESAFANANKNHEKLKAEGKFSWSFYISLITTRKVTFFASSSHDLETISQNDSKTESIFQLPKTCVPKKQFIFSYATEDQELPSCVFGRSDKSSTAMLSFIPKFCSLSLNDAYKSFLEGKVFEDDINSAKGQYVFLLDRSGSMEGKRISKAKQALILFIKSLPKDSYFNIISFGSTSESLFKQTQRYQNKSIEEAVQKVKSMQADLAGTIIYKPLSDLLQKKPKKGYPMHVFLLTDGEVCDTQRIIKMVGRNNKFARVHTIGVSNDASKELIEGCALKGKGKYVFIDDYQDPSDKIIQLLAESLSPLVAKISLEFDNELVEIIVPNPHLLPYYLKGELVNFYITFKGQLTQKAHFTLSYEDSVNRLPYSAQITVDPESSNYALIDRMRHQKHIQKLLQCLANDGQIMESMLIAKKLNIRQQVIKESIVHQILSEFTAFVAVEKELIDGKLQQIKDKGKAHLLINLSSQHRSLFHNEEIRSNHSKHSTSKFFPYDLQQMRFNTLTKISQPKQKHLHQQRSPVAQKSGFFSKLAIFFKELFNKQEQMLIKDQSSPNQIKTQQKQMVTISQLVSLQQSDGSWRDMTIIERLFGQQASQVIGEMQDPIATGTYLIAKWIQNRHPQVQYSLIIKKALAFTSQNSEQLQKCYAILKKYNQRENNKN